MTVIQKYQNSARTTKIAIKRAALVFSVVLGIGQAHAGAILYVADDATAGARNDSIVTVLAGDGHTVTSVFGDYSGGSNPTLLGGLASFDAVYWAASGNGFGDLHTDATVFTNLSSYVSGGGAAYLLPGMTLQLRQLILR